MQTGKTALDDEVARELGISGNELLEWQSQLKVTNVVSLNEFIEQGSEPVMDARHNSHFRQTEERVQETELREKLQEAMEQLTEKEKKVIEKIPQSILYIQNILQHYVLLNHLEKSHLGFFAL